MLLSIGMVGQAVRKLQGDLNRLPTLLARLKEDGAFGPLTRSRVREFQGNNALDIDGIVGPLTQAIIDALLSALGGSKPGTASGAVRPINQEVLGQPGTNNLVVQQFPSMPFIIPAFYRRNDPKNLLQFMSAPPLIGRIGTFAARKGTEERFVILMLPMAGIVDRVMVYVPQIFAQAAKNLDPTGWENPTSPPFVEYCLINHVIGRFGPQILSSRPNTALVYLGRAKAASELGPFAGDGPFLKQVLGDLTALTNGAFAYSHFETFTFSSGIVEFNRFVGAIKGHFSIEKIYNLDPTHAMPAAVPPGVSARQFSSGVNLHFPIAPPGFELVDEPRWANEFLHWKYAKGEMSRFAYLHNHCAANYFLRLALTT